VPIANKLTCLAVLTLSAPLLLSPTLTPHAEAASASPVHGAQLFVDTGCSHCHGPAGSGGDRGPDLKNVAHRMTAAKMTTQIHDGGQAMPPFGDVLTTQDITDLVAYLRSRRKPPVPPAHESAPPPQ
jgi:mono/diheme cytochrome c family protein